MKLSCEINPSLLMSEPFDRGRRHGPVEVVRKVDGAVLSPESGSSYLRCFYQ